VETDNSNEVKRKRGKGQTRREEKGGEREGRKRKRKKKKKGGKKKRLQGKVNVGRGRKPQMLITQKRGV